MIYCVYYMPDLEALKERVKLHYDEAVEYRDKGSSFIEEVDEATDMADVSSKLNELILSYSGFPNNASKKKANCQADIMVQNKRRFTASLIDAQESAFIGAASKLPPKKIQSIGGSEQAGLIAEEVRKDVSESDMWETKNMDLIRSAFKYNAALLFIDKVDGQGQKLDIDSFVISAKDGLFDQHAKVNDLQKSRYIGYSGIKKSKEDLMLMRDLHAERQDKFSKEIAKEIDERYTLDSSTDQQYYEKNIDCVRLMIYIQEDNVVIDTLYIPEQDLIVDYEKREVVSQGIKDLRYDMWSIVFNRDNGIYSQPPLYKILPLVKSLSQSLSDIISAMHQESVNPILTTSELFKDVHRAIVDGKPVVSTRESSVAEGAVVQIPKPDVSTLARAQESMMSAFNRYLPDNVASLVEAVQKKTGELSQTFAPELVVKKYYMQSISRMYKDSCDIFMKLLRVYAGTDILVRSTGFLGTTQLRKVLKSKILGDYKKLDTISFDVVSDLSNTNEGKLDRRELAPLVLSEGNNIQNATRIILRKYNMEEEEIDKILNPQSLEVIDSVYTDLKKVALGENVEPSVMYISTDYIDFLEEIIKRNKAYLNDDEELYKRVLDFVKKVGDLREEQTDNPAFQDNENKEMDSRLRYQKKLDSIAQGESKAGSPNYAVQTDSYKRGDLEARTNT